MRGFQCLFAAVCFAGVAFPASAADWGNLSGDVAVTSDYRFRGLTGNDHRPALQGEVDWSNDDGWEAGLWSSMINFKDNQNTRVELDVSGGKRVELRGTIVDFTVTYYTYPIRNRPAAAPVYSFFEAAMKASHSWGDLTLSGQIGWSPNSFAESGMSWYLGAGASYRLLEWLTASANVGRQWVRNVDAIPEGGYPYTHWDAGLTATYGKLSLDVRYVDTSLNSHECLLSFGIANGCAAGGLATLTYAIGD